MLDRARLAGPLGALLLAACAGPRAAGAPAQGSAMGPAIAPAPPAPFVDPEGVLLRSLYRCYERGLAYNPAFAQGGVIEVTWEAGISGRLSSIGATGGELARLEVDSSGETLASCASRLARASGGVAWPARGSRRVRFGADDPPAR